MIKENSRAICFGEVLWDNLPEGRQPGGAPLNVAYHLNQLGIGSTMVSRVGNDKNGTDLVRFIRDKGIPVQFVQTDAKYDTSEVAVRISEENEVSYEIVYPVAWDFISPDPRLDQLVRQAEVFVFGSLSSRAEMTSRTLRNLLDKVAYKVFDVNLRPPFVNRETLENLLQQTDLLKLNNKELDVIVAWYGQQTYSETKKVSFLQDRFGIAEMIVTKGGFGASYYSGTEKINQYAHSIQVRDTVGSGDAFLAGFIASRLKGKNQEESLNYAAALAGFVSINSGACPSYHLSDIESFMQEYPIHIILPKNQF